MSDADAVQTLATRLKKAPATEFAQDSNVRVSVFFFFGIIVRFTLLPHCERGPDLDSSSSSWMCMPFQPAGDSPSFGVRCV